MGARLVPSERGRPRAELALPLGRVAIGSAADNGIVLRNQTISRHHAIVEVGVDACLVTDAGSTNGTFVNGQRVLAATPIRDGDELRLGALRYVFREKSGGPPRALGGIVGDRRRLGLVVLAALLAFGGATAVALFVINFNRLEIGSFGATPGANLATGSSAAADTDGTPSYDEEGGSKPWLDALNNYRAMAGLAAVRSKPEFSRGAALHSRYIARNYADQIRHQVNLGGAMHHEDPSKPGFTTEGAAAGMAGDVDEMYDPDGTARVSWAIDDWMVGPFHRLSLLDPRLQSVGYGDYCDSGVCIATLNARGDLRPVALVSKRSDATVEYPPNGASVARAELTAEWPDPLTSCPGYASPAGLPISLQLGPRTTPIVTSSTLTLDADPLVPVEACTIDANSYRNSDSATQTVGRDLLREYGAVIIVPRQPLTAGRYTVALAAGGRDYSWSFAVKP